jgi:hypothetical protein
MSLTQTQVDLFSLMIRYAEIMRYNTVAIIIGDHQDLSAKASNLLAQINNIKAKLTPREIQKVMDEIELFGIV